MTDNTFVSVIFASLLACLVTTIGIYAISEHEEWGRKNTAYFMSFAAGVLISVSFMHIIPKSFQMHVQAPAFLLGGFLALYLLNRLLKLYMCHEYQSDTLAIGIIPFVGIGFHSFLDGIIYSVTFNVNVFTGALAAVGMVCTNFPKGSSRF